MSLVIKEATSKGERAADAFTESLRDCDKNERRYIQVSGIMFGWWPKVGRDGWNWGT